MNAKPVYVCAECYDLDCQIHGDSAREYQCQLCCKVHTSIVSANTCCKHLVNNEVLDSRHFAKEVKKEREKAKEYPTALLKGIR